MKKIRCKLCPTEFDSFENLQFHFAEAHAKVYRRQVVPQLSDLDYKVTSCEFPANEGMHGHFEGNISTHKQAKESVEIF
jgi:hypothetical protein